MFRRRSATARYVAVLALAAVSGSRSRPAGARARSSASSATSGGASTSATAAASTTSGSWGPCPLFRQRPNGLIPALGSGYPANYEGFTDSRGEVRPGSTGSPRISRAGTCKSCGPLTNPFTNTTLNALKQRLMASGKVRRSVCKRRTVHGCSAATAGDRDRDSAQAGHPDRVPTRPPADRSAHRPAAQAECRRSRLGR